MSIRVHVVRPYRLRFLKILGWLMIGLGGVIFAYLTGVYLAWGRAAPRLSGEQVLGEATSVVGASWLPHTTWPATSFGRLLALDTKADPAPKVDAQELAQQRSVLGLKNARPHKSAYQEFYLTIPRLGIRKAKVTVDVDGTAENIYLGVLKKAVAHFRGTAYPGELGNSFLFGHSMLPILASSSYESIFTHLPRLKRGDAVYVEYSGQKFTYRIRQTGVVDPTDVAVLRQPNNERLLTLMTCIPPGFGSNRFVAVGELIEASNLNE